MRKVLLGVIAFAVGVGGILLLLVVLSGRDSGGVDTGAGTGPGQAIPLQSPAHHAAPAGFHYSSSPPTSGPHRVVTIPADGHRLTTDQLLSALEIGDIVLLHPPGRAPAGLVKAQRTVVGGPSTRGDRTDGQAVIIATYPGTGTKTVAVAWGRLLRTARPTDPRVAVFADHWLGAGAPVAK